MEPGSAARKNRNAPTSLAVKEPSSKAHKAGARRILLTAEKLFGEHGMNGVSLRQILAAAGHANKSAVYFHFGSKEGLILATFDLRMPALEKARYARLRDSEKRGAVGVKELLEALFLPFVDISPGSARRACAKFHLQLNLYHLGNERPAEQWVNRSAAAVEIDASLRRALPHLPKEVFDARFSLIVSLVLTGVARLDGRDARRFQIAGRNMADDLISMATAALEAPWREP